MSEGQYELEHELIEIAGMEEEITEVDKNEPPFDLAQLKDPFGSSHVKWRIGSTMPDKTKGMALTYIDARVVEDRLDSVVGPENWQSRFPISTPNRTICEIGIKINGEWVWKSDGAGDTDIEGTKGGLSDAFKRAAVAWGVGRYLYGLPATWVALKDGKYIQNTEYARLKNEYEKHVFGITSAPGGGGERTASPEETTPSPSSPEPPPAERPDPAEEYRPGMETHPAPPEPSGEVWWPENPYLARTQEMAEAAGLDAETVFTFVKKTYRYKNGKPVTNMKFLGKDNQIGLEAAIQRGAIKKADPNEVPATPEQWKEINTHADEIDEANLGGGNIPDLKTIMKEQGVDENTLTYSQAEKLIARLKVPF